MRRIAVLLVALTLSSCITTNVTAWANTRDKPLLEHLRVTVWALAIVPSLVADAVLAPIQIVGDMYPYGYDFKPRAQVRPGRADTDAAYPPRQETGAEHHTGPHGRRER